MLAVIAMFPAYILPGPSTLWKSFDLFVGLIQAFIFSLLTVLYFSQAMETEDHLTNPRSAPSTRPIDLARSHRQFPPERKVLNGSPRLVWAP